VSETVLADTSFWIALFDERESEHKRMGTYEELLELVTLVVPWPIMYETLRTRFVRRPEWVFRLDKHLKKPTVEFIDDKRYREEAYSLTVDYSTRMKWPISMVDMLCRLLIDDPNLRIDYLLTTNPEDFADLCRRNNVTLL
jgi:predicted nucleic acid-binding protein